MYMYKSTHVLMRMYMLYNIMRRADPHSVGLTFSYLDVAFYACVYRFCLRLCCGCVFHAFLDIPSYTLALLFYVYSL